MTTQHSFDRCATFAELATFIAAHPDFLINFSEAQCSSGGIVQVIVEGRNPHDEQYRFTAKAPSTYTSLWTDHTHRKYRKCENAEFIAWFRPKLIEYINNPINAARQVYIDVIGS